VGGYIAYAGGKVRHREFRNEPPPEEGTAEAIPNEMQLGQESRFARPPLR